jgi:histone deacetylase complex regulatory component SIN3
VDESLSFKGYIEKVSNILARNVNVIQKLNTLLPNGLV